MIKVVGFVGKLMGRGIARVIIATILISGVMTIFGEPSSNSFIREYIQLLKQAFSLDKCGQVWDYFWKTTSFFIFCGFFFSSLFTVLFLKNNISSILFRFILTVISCMPVFVVGKIYRSCFLTDNPWILFLVGGFILGICDCFWNELFRHSRMEIKTISMEDWLLMAKAKGSKLWRHCWREVFIHSTKILSHRLVVLISGAVVIEYVFGFSGIEGKTAGIGTVVVRAVKTNDLPLFLTIIILMVTIVILIDIVKSFLDWVLDPRLRIEGLRE